MIMGARHHLWGSGCVPHRVSMTRRWGPVGFMRVGGMGLGALGPPSPVGFPDFASYQTAVISSFPPCPAPFDPVCENPRDAAISNALIQWKLNPRSCANVVCDASGNPQATPPPSGSGSGFNTSTGFVPVTSTVPAVISPRPGRFKPYAPPQPSVVNPSPSTQLTTTGSTTTAPGSAVSQANGMAAVPGTLASTVGGVVSTTDTSGDIISGLPNWVLFVAGGVALVLLTRK